MMFTRKMKKIVLCATTFLLLSMCAIGVWLPNQALEFEASFATNGESQKFEKVFLEQLKDESVPVDRELAANLIKSQSDWTHALQEVNEDRLISMNQMAKALFCLVFIHAIALVSLLFSRDQT